MKKIIFKALATIFLLTVAIVFGIAFLNYYHVNNANAMLCAVVGGFAIVTIVLSLD